MKATNTLKVYSPLSLNSYIKPLNAKHNIFYIRTHWVQRSEPHQFPCKKNQLFNAVCYGIHTKHIHTIRVEFLNVKSSGM